MLYSRAMNVGFAHYPKTAGHSLTRWFLEAFPDAEFVARHPRYEINHLPVRESLERLGLVRPRGAQRDGRLSRAVRRLGGGPWLDRAAARRESGGARCSTRIIGVVREPFDMLVSLFEYWRRFDFAEEPTLQLIRCARTGTFREFLTLAVVERQVLNYRDFFDMEGPAAASTRLLAFDSLEHALEEVCREFRLPMPAAKLGQLNASPNRRRDLTPYVAEAGSLLADVRSHFRWYYETGSDRMVTGAGRGASGTPPAERAWPRFFAARTRPEISLAAAHVG
jgi:hypothetical protein